MQLQSKSARLPPKLDGKSKFVVLFADLDLFTLSAAFNG